MSERARGSIEITALRIEKTDVGAATAVIDAELLTLVVRSRAGQEERPLRLKLAAIDSAQLSGDRLALALRNGTHVSIASPEAAALRDDIFARCRALPEMTRTLRAFGSRRGRSSVRETEAAEQRRFFSGLMDARRTVGAETLETAAASAMSAIAAFDAAALIRALDETLHAFAVERHGDNGPARRALEAELVDLSEPLHAALRRLAETAGEAESAPHDLRRWRAWALQLRIVFETADRAWFALDAALDASTSPR
jgi:hypothetical protein